MKKRLVTTAYKRMNAFDDVRVLCKKIEYAEDESPHVAPIKNKFSYGPVLSVAAVIFIFAFSMSSVFASSTISYFSDVERSLDNLLHAGSLDFTVALADPGSASIKLTAGAASVTIVPTVSPGAGDFPLAYKVHVQKTAGTSDAFCNAIDVSATSGAFTYTGKLMAFVEGTTTDVSPLSLSLSLPANSNFTIADNCSVDVVYSGWVDGQTEGIEYHDVERVSLFISDPPAATSTDVTVPISVSAATSDITPEASTTDATSTALDVATSTETTPPVDVGGGGGGTPPSDDPVVTPPADDTTMTPPADITTPPTDTTTTDTPPADTTVVETPPPPDTPPADPTVDTPPPASDTAPADTSPPPVDTPAPPPADTASSS